MAAERTYRWATEVLATKAAMPELPAASGAAPTVRFIVARVRARQRISRWDHAWRLPRRSPWLLVKRHDDGGYLLRFPEIADFALSADRRVVTCEAGTRVDDATLRHLLLDQILPLVAAARRGGRTVLHAAAVVVDGTGVAFAGRTGRGKSTLAAAFASAGDRLLTDDALVIEQSADGVTAFPSYASVRIWRDVATHLRCRAGARVARYTRKLRVDPRGDRRMRFEMTPARIDRLYIVECAGGRRVRFESLPRRDAFVELVRHSFLLDPFDRGELARRAADIANLAREIPVSRLFVPHGLELLPVVRAAVRADLLDRAAGAA